MLSKGVTIVSEGDTGSSILSFWEKWGIMFEVKGDWFPVEKMKGAMC